MWEAENKAQEARNVVERLQKQRQAADRVVEDAEARLRVCKERAADDQLRITQLRDEQTQLKGQVAESPEGLEQEIEELKAALRQKRAFVESKEDEKRQRAARDRVLGEVQGHLEVLAETLDKATSSATRVEAAREKNRAAHEELTDLHKAAESQKAERAELEEQVRALQADIERAKDLHVEKERELDARRQLALQKHQEVQAKRTDEERAYYALQGQRLELESELKQKRRKFQAQRAELERQLQACQHDREAYAQSIDKLLQTGHGVETFGPYPRQEIAASPPPRQTLRSPGKHLRSPARSPGRSLAGFRSPLGGATFLKTYPSRSPDPRPQMSPVA